MSVLAPLEKELGKLWLDATGQARADAEKALAEVKTELAKVQPLLSTFGTDLKGAVAAADPALKTAVEALLSKLLQDVGAVLLPKL